MTKKSNADEISEDIFQSILATPNRQRKLLSKTFWSRYGVKARTAKTVQNITNALSQRSVVINIKPQNHQDNSDANVLGKEKGSDWIILTYVEMPPESERGSGADHIHTPTDTWFTKIEQSVFESEREVEYYFIMPMLKQLDYEEDDIAIEFPVKMAAGSKIATKHADIAVFAGPGRTETLLVIEAKKASDNDKVLRDAATQAKSYALWLSAPFYLITDGETTKIFLFQGHGFSDVEQLSFVRNEMRQSWKVIYEMLNKTSVVEYRRRFISK